MSRHFSTFYGKPPPSRSTTSLAQPPPPEDESSDEINERTIIQSALDKEPFATSEVRKHFKDLVKNVTEWAG